MGNNLKALRVASKKTQTQVARDLGIKVDTYRSWEQGKRNPTGQMGIRLAEYFGVSTDTVFGSPFAEPVAPRLATDEEELIELYRRLNVESRLAVRTVAYALGINQLSSQSQGVSLRIPDEG